MSKKRKSKANSIADLHFVSSLQLEQSLQLISDLADDHHHVTVTTVDENQIQFEIEYLENNQRLARIKGTLQRWQGTETKLDADGSVERLGVRENNIFGRIVANLFGFYLYRDLDETKTIQQLGFRHRDYLLQLLIDTFKANGDVKAL